MATVFIRRGGKEEKFRPEKVKRSIRLAAKDSHIMAKRAHKVVTEVSRAVLALARKRKTMKAAVLRKHILAKLDRVEPAVAKAWRVYERRRRARRAKRR